MLSADGLTITGGAPPLTATLAWVVLRSHRPRRLPWRRRTMASLLSTRRRTFRCSRRRRLQASALCT